MVLNKVEREVIVVRYCFFNLPECYRFSSVAENKKPEEALEALTLTFGLCGISLTVFIDQQCED